MITQMPRSSTVIGVEPGLPRAARGHPEPDQIGGGQQDAVGVDGDRVRGQTGLDARRPSPTRSKIISTTPTEMAASATLNAQKCQPRKRKIHVVEHIAGSRAIDQIADRSSQYARDAEPREPIRDRHRHRIPADAHQREAGDHRQHEGLARELHAVEHAERRPGVVDARQGEKARNDVDALVELGRAPHHAPW